MSPTSTVVSGLMHLDMTLVSVWTCCFSPVKSAQFNVCMMEPDANGKAFWATLTVDMEGETVPHVGDEDWELVEAMFCRPLDADGPEQVRARFRRRYCRSEVSGIVVRVRGYFTTHE